MSIPEHYTVLNDSGQTAVRLALKLTGILLVVSVLAAVFFVVGPYRRNRMQALRRQATPAMRSCAVSERIANCRFPIGLV
jgi:hypothetical protein